MRHLEVACECILIHALPLDLLKDDYAAVKVDGGYAVREIRQLQIPLISSLQSRVDAVAIDRIMKLVHERFGHRDEGPVLSALLEFAVAHVCAT